MEPVETRAHVVSQLSAPDGPLQLVPHTEHLIGRDTIDGDHQGSIPVHEGAGEDLGRIEGMPHVEVALDVNDRA